MPESSSPEATEPDPLGVIAREIVTLQKARLGRGPVRAQAELRNDLLTVILYEPYTPLELTIAEANGPDALLEQRRRIHKLMGELYRPVVEEQLGRRVLAVMSANHVGPDVAIKLFLLGDIIDSA